MPNPFIEMNHSNRLAIVVLVIGSTQMVGYLTGIRALRGIGLASGIAPFPKVFCEADGYEAFAAHFRIEGVRADGTSWSCEMCPERYSQMSGPYNRRNVHGATLAFAPRLPEDLRKSLLSQALQPGSSLRRELAIPDDVDELKIVITPRDGEAHGPWTYDARGEEIEPCTEE